MNKKIYLYFHDDFDGIVSCVLAFYLLKELSFKPIIGKPVYSEEILSWRKLKIKVKKPFASLDLPYRKDALVYFDHHSSNKPSKISKITKYWKFKQADSCAQVIFDYIKDKNLLGKKSIFRELVKKANIGDAALFSKFGIPPLETIKPKRAAGKIAVLLGNFKYDKGLRKKIINDLIKELDLEKIAKKNYIKERYKKIWPNIKVSLKKFKENSGYASQLHKKFGLVTYKTLSYRFMRFAPAVFYPKSLVWIGLVKQKKIYSIKISKNPWNHKSDILFKKGLHIGNILKKFGGGGHASVGAAQFTSYKKTKESMKIVVKEIEKNLLKLKSKSKE